MEELNLMDIGNDNLEHLDLNMDSATSKFGSGFELLMNDKKRSSSGSGRIDMKELGDLENELNELTGQTPIQTKTVSSSGFGNFFGFSQKNASPTPEVVLEHTDSNIGHATQESLSGTSKTWDGFSKQMPVSSKTTTVPSSERERNRKKRAMIKKLEEWYEKGSIKNISHYTVDSAYEEIEDEYESALEDKRKKDGIKLQAYWLKTFVSSVEWANSTFDPFGLDLGGLSDTVEDDIDSYDEIFSELHDKYSGGKKIPPELSLCLKLGLSVSMIHITNSSLTNIAPGLQDVLKQSPQLMKAFTNATVDAMKEKSPGFAFAQGLVKDPPNMSSGPPPAPLDTRTNQPIVQKGTMNFTERPNQQRPDISLARGTTFRPEQPQDIRQQQQQQTQQEGIDVGGHASYTNPPQQQQQPQSQFSPPPRAEMKGPSSDIDNLLAGLKTVSNDGNSKKNMSRRKPRSEKNIMSLDI